MTIEKNIKDIKTDISVIKQSSNLSFPETVLLAVSKTQPPETIEKAIKAGLTEFGENRVQEAEAKWLGLQKRYPNIRLHLIGPLQTNKVKAALALFDVIQTLDRPKLADAIAKELKSWGIEESKKKTIPQFSNSSIPQFYIQVNTGEEPQKAGVIPEEADAFIDYCIKELTLPVVGLMCIPPEDQPPAPHFALLKKIADRHGLKELSMGMSEDYATAIRMGSTCIRVGRKLFGERHAS